MESARCPQPKCEGSLEFIGMVYRPSFVSDYIVIERCNTCNGEIMYAVIDEESIESERKI